MTMRPFISAVALCCLLFPLSAVAHNPVVIDGGPSTLESAWLVEDVDVSRVAYHHAKAGQPEIWFRFDAEAGQELFLQLGVPALDRYESLRPAMALIGPGLPVPMDDFPFPLPEGYGALYYPTNGSEQTFFHEEFTGTDSWQFPAERPTAPETGQYYLVGHLPHADEGKFWLAVGTLEQFGIADILSLPQTLFAVRAFHEVGPIGGILFWAMAAFFLLIALGLIVLL